MNRRLLTSLVAVIGCITALFAAYRFGLDGGLARATYVDTISLREEQKCFASADLACLRAHWELRAGIAAEGARREAATPFPTGVGEELGAYLQWYEKSRNADGGAK